MALTLKLDDIKPLLGAVGIGGDATPKPDAAAPPMPPAPPPPTPPQAGFSAYSADPRNQQTIANSLTMPGTPITPPNVPPASPLSPSPTPPPSLRPFNPMADIQPLPATPNMGGGPPALPASPSPNVQPLTLKRWEDQNPDQVAKPMLSGRGKVGNILNFATAGLTGAAGGLKGDPTAGVRWISEQAANDRQIPQLNQQRYNAAVVQPEKDAAQIADTQSQTVQRTAMAAKANAQADAAGDPAQQRAKDIAAAAKLGSKPVYDEKGTLTGYAPDETSTVYQKNQALAQYEQARSEAAQAQAELNKSKNDPKSPAYQQAQQRLRIAQQNAQTAVGRLGLSAQEFGFNQDKFYNPQPTATQRTKGDLAQSAVERVAEMKGVVAKHPEWFGPGAGRISNVQAAIGSQDPDMQTYLSAAQYLSDHSAGVFGGRGKYITEQLHTLTDPKMNPAALGAALDEAEKSATGFVSAGKIHGKGQTSSYGAGNPSPSPAGGVEEYVRVNGKLVKKGGK